MTPLAHDIKTLVQAAGFAGIRVKAIKAAFGCGVETASKHLSTLEAARLVERSRVTGQSVVWGPVGTWEHHESALAAAALVAFNKRNGAAQRADPDTDLEDGRPHAFVHRLVSAADCAPLRPTAPVSVFHVAGWAA